MPDSMSVLGDWARLGVVLLLMAVGFGCKSDENARNQLLQFRNAVQLGSTKQALEALLTAEQYPALRLLKKNDEVWIVATPYVFGASNWWLYVEFVNSAVVAVRVRTEDSASHMPAGAPIDLVAK